MSGPVAQTFFVALVVFAIIVVIFRDAGDVIFRAFAASIGIVLFLAMIWAWPIDLIK